MIEAPTIEGITLKESPLVARMRFGSAFLRARSVTIDAKYRARLLHRVFPGDIEAFDGFASGVIEEISDLVCQALELNITHNDDLPVIDPCDRVLNIANHPSLSGAFVWADLIRKKSVRNTVVAAKAEFRTNPIYRYLIGDLMKMTYSTIFLNRNVREEALRSIREEIGKIFLPGTGAILFPDQHRPSKAAISGDIEKYKRKFPDIESWINHTCFPSRDGLFALRSSVPDPEKLRILDSTIVEPGPYEIGGKFHVRVQELKHDDLFGNPPSKEHLGNRLVELWMEKNTFIGDMKN